MLTKDDVLEAVVNECQIIKHLAERIPEGGLDYRPTPGQRSTLELLRYLSFCAIGAARKMTEGTWDAYSALEEESKTLEASQFEARMNRQVVQLREWFAGLTDEEFQTRKANLPNGKEVKLGQGILDTTVRWLTAYRHQLFLHAKQAGASQLGTMNNWYGVDAEPKS